MIEYIKEYGITSLDYEYILHNVSRDVIQALSLSENSVREVLDFYNDIGITKNISKIIKKSIDDLILLGI